MKTTICTTIEEDLWKKARSYGISWNLALERGINILIIERGELILRETCKELDVEYHEN